MKGLIILLTEFRQRNCESKEVSIKGYQFWIDCQSIQPVLSVEAEQKADSDHPELLLGAEPMACVLWMRFLQHNQANPEVLARLRLEIDRHDALTAFEVRARGAET